MARGITNTIEDFWSLVDKSGDCWLWTGKSHVGKGYGTIHLEGVQWRVHRLAFKEYHPDTFNPDLDVLHKCDVMLCVKEEHLFQGTNDDNVRDKVAKGRQSHKPTTTGMSFIRSDIRLFTDEQIRDIRYRVNTTSMRALGAEFGVSHEAIRQIYYRKSYKEVLS